MKTTYCLTRNHCIYPASSSVKDILFTNPAYTKQWFLGSILLPLQRIKDYFHQHTIFLSRAHCLYIQLLV